MSSGKKQALNLCSSDEECYSRNCVEDYVGGKYCAPPGMCVHDLKFYYNGSKSEGYVCRNTVWIKLSQNGESCSSDDECYSGYCKDDIGPSSNGYCEEGENCWCCDWDQCAHDGVCYNPYAACNDVGECYEQEDIPPGFTTKYRCEDGNRFYWHLIV